MDGRSRRIASLLVTGLLALGIAGTVSAYEGEVAANVSVTRVTTTVSCTSNVEISATVVDASGKLIADQTVAWAITSSPTSEDQLVNATSKTDSSGVATNFVDLACVVGERTITATADGAVAGLVLGLTSVGLPPTDTVAGEGSTTTPPSGTFALVWLLAAITFVAVFATRRRRLR